MSEVIWWKDNWIERLTFLQITNYKGLILQYSLTLFGITCSFGITCIFLLRIVDSYYKPIVPIGGVGENCKKVFFIIIIIYNYMCPQNCINV